jgi:hypothetical protein
MASNTELLEKLTGSITLPGLDVNTILEASFAKAFKEQLEIIDSPEEREQLRTSLYESYVTSNKKKVQEGIAELKSAFTTAKGQVDSIIPQAREAITTAAIPSVIGTAAPNPIREVLEMKSKKETLETILATAVDNLVRVVIVAEKIEYDIPKIVEDVIIAVGTAKSVLDAIPTKLS